MYTRVIPRDFFNEAKLLKCLGRLELLILDNEKPARDLKITSEFDNEAFNVVQDPNSGSISVSNYRVFVNGEELYLSTPLNSKENYPLTGIYKGEEYYIFDEKGQFMPNFGLNYDMDKIVESFKPLTKVSR
jgi:hypothetical protein